ncbi:MAG: DMT family transporter [Simkaniaceae bacterium]|nr:DMT family transporter [Simkaniaceae bacterium]
MGVLLSLFLFSIWSTVFPIGKWLVGFSTPVFLTGIRMLFAGVLLIGFLLIRNRKALKINKKQLLSISLLALLSIYLTNVLEFYGLQHLSAAKTCFIYSLSPFLTALFSFIHFKEKMNKTKWIGMIIGFSGVLPVLFIQNQSGDLLSLFKFIALP